MMTTRLLAIPLHVIASTLLVVSLTHCSNSSAGDPVLAEYLKSTWGITLTGFTGDFNASADGTQVYDGTGKITVDGLGTSDIATQTIVSPVAQGGDTTLFVRNTDGSGERYFLYDQVQNYITIGDLTKGVAVSKNPDSTYDIWAFNGDNKDQFLTAPNGFEALKIVEQYNEFKSISPYILLTAFASAHATGPAARFTLRCAVSNTAAVPPVCDIFKEFCDCAACLVLNRKGACSQCPKL